jgi:hypothetical protein
MVNSPSIIQEQWDPSYKRTIKRRLWMTSSLDLIRQGQSKSNWLRSTSSCEGLWTSDVPTHWSRGAKIWRTLELTFLDSLEHVHGARELGKWGEGRCGHWMLKWDCQLLRMGIQETRQETGTAFSYFRRHEPRHALHTLEDPTNKTEGEAKVNEATSTYNNLHMSNSN